MPPLPCPRCSTALAATPIGGIAVDVCESCGGLWLDRLELARFEEPDSVLGEALLAPTVLYAMGLPTAESFAGRARLELFRDAFRRHHPLHTISTWGEPRDGQGTASAVDQAIIEQLAALGYIE